MKKTLLGLILSSMGLLASASTPTATELSALEVIETNLSNPDLYKNHKISIYKEEKHKFLFIPYTKDVLVNETVLTGVNNMTVYEHSKSYISAVSQVNEVTTIHPGVIKTGLFLNVFKLENSNVQVLTVNQKELISLNEIIVEDKKVELPNMYENTNSFTIDSPSFEKKWIDSIGVTYKLKYIGSKNLN